MDYVELFGFVTGVVFLTLQVLQSRWMWTFQIMTSAAFVAVYANQHLWATMSLNVYYVIMSLVGIWSWAKAAKQMAGRDQDSGKTIHLVRLDRGTLFVSAGLLLSGAACIIPVLTRLDDPRPVIDGIVLCMSAIGTWWLTRSHLQQWLVWIVADTTLLVLNVSQGLVWATATTAFYVVMSFVGYFNWKKKGVYIG